MSEAMLSKVNEWQDVYFAAVEKADAEGGDARFEAGQYRRLTVVREYLAERINRTG